MMMTGIPPRASAEGKSTRASSTTNETQRECLHAAVKQPVTGWRTVHHTGELLFFVHQSNLITLLPKLHDTIKFQILYPLNFQVTLKAVSTLQIPISCKRVGENEEDR